MRNRSFIVAFLPLLLALGMGCQQVKQIPLFNPEARPLNRVASANELITELNHKTADYVARGWLSQASVNESIGPALDKAAALADVAESLLRGGEQQPGLDKLATLDAVLASLRQQLADIERRESLKRRGG